MKQEVNMKKLKLNLNKVKETNSEKIPMKILIVEDSENARKQYQELFMPEGYELLEAENGFELSALNPPALNPSATLKYIFADSLIS